jgi:D-alanine-D-alanine ligase-like ATP-grasp enzyme
MYCGANQVSHTKEWLQQNSEILISPGRRRVIYNPVGRLLQSAVDAGIDGSIRFAATCGLIQYNTNPELIKSFRGRELFKEALARGLTIRELRPRGNAADLYEVVIAGKPFIFKGLPRPKGYSNPALEWSDDKAILKTKLHAAGLPVAHGASVYTWKKALQLFHRLQKPVIIKPRLGSRGRHTTTFIYTEEQLREAYRIAKQLCSWMVIEEHLVGAVYRGTVIGGKCIGVLGGDPPYVIGDGTNTITELIALKNKHTNPGVKDIVIDEKMSQFLGRSGYTLESILPTAMRIDVTEKIGVSYGGSSFEVTSETHPDTIRMFEDAAAIIQDPLLGFDFIIPDITKSWRGQRCGIIECNAVPFINLHHDPLHGTPVNAAKYVWDMIEQSATEKK